MGYRLSIAGIFLLFTILEFGFGRYLHRDKTVKKDIVLEVVSVFAVPLLIVPVLLFLAAPALAEWCFPGSEGFLSHWPWWLMFLAFLLADDLTQYWWHRLSHSVPFLYGLHRAHHSASYMSV